MYMFQVNDEKEKKQLSKKQQKLEKEKVSVLS